MPRLFWPNFEFEHELAAGENWQPSQKLRRLNARFAPVLSALCAPEDFIVFPDPPHEEQIVVGHDWELVPWGVTHSLQRLAKRRGWIWRQPACEVVKTLNDRVTAFEWEQREQVAPDGLALLESEADLNLALQNLPTDRWIIKARFGMSARERIVGTGSTLSELQRGWLRKRLAEQHAVVLEPWLESVAEAGLQFDVPQVGPPHCLAVLPLMNTATGEYLGSRLYLTQEELAHWQPAIEIGQRLATETQSLGYFGPLGIDAMLYRSGDEVRLRPVQDINARWTMGRIAWEWGQRLAPGQKSTWLAGNAVEEILADPPEDARIISTSSNDGIASALVIGEGDFKLSTSPPD